MAKRIKGCPKLPWMIDFHRRPDTGLPNSQLTAAFADTHIDYQAKLNVRSCARTNRLTGIICTMGPSSSDACTLQCMMECGMTGIQVKMCTCSSCCHDECAQALEQLQIANDNYSRKIGRIYPVAVILDIRGPEIRTGSFQNPNIHEIEFKAGDNVSITADPNYEEHVSADMIFVDYQKIDEIVEPGDRISIGDGDLHLSALEIVGSVIRCIVEEAGKLLSGARVSLEGVPVELPILSEKDIEDIHFGVEYRVDAITVAGVRNKATLQQVREALGPEGNYVLVITKIDNAKALDNIDEIIQGSDGILINRALLANVMPAEKVFLAQKSIIAKCNEAGKPVLFASGILESMVSSGHPKNNEVSDIANAILDGVDSFLLSKETSTGDNPIDSVRTLSAICKEAEAATYHGQLFADLTAKRLSPIEPIYALCIGAVEASLKCNAAAIIILTTAGRSAKVLASFRPRCPILAITRFPRVARQLHLFRAVNPLQYIDKGNRCWESDDMEHGLKCVCWEKDVADRIQVGITWGKVAGYIRAGDAIVIVTGTRPGAGFTNSMQIVYASDFDAIPQEELK